MDGGLGQEIYRRAGKSAHPLWSARVMMDQPNIVKEVHQDFIRAGAKIITINSYTCTPTRLQRDGEVEWFEKLQTQAINIATDARDELGSMAADLQIAGCLPPLVGSYTSDQRTFQELKQEYEQIVAIQAPQVDLFIIETISNSKEAQAAIEAALPASRPILLSFTLSDQNPANLRSGESIADALSAITKSSLSGLLFNCSFPETISQGLEFIRHTEIPFGGYANGFTSVDPLKPGGTVDSLAARTDLNEEKYASHAMDWVAKGATFIGGCCEVGPSYINYLHEELPTQGYNLVSFKV